MIPLTTDQHNRILHPAVVATSPTQVISLATHWYLTPCFLEWKCYVVSCFLLGRAVYSASGYKWFRLYYGKCFTPYTGRVQIVYNSVLSSALLEKKNSFVLEICWVEGCLPYYRCPIQIRHLSQTKFSHCRLVLLNNFLTISSPRDEFFVHLAVDVGKGRLLLSKIFRVLPPEQAQMLLSVFFRNLHKILFPSNWKDIVSVTSSFLAWQFWLKFLVAWIVWSHGASNFTCTFVLSGFLSCHLA